jgi:uncharacterized protein
VPLGRPPEEVFGWRFEPWGPPDFFHIDTDTGTETGAGPLGALQRRRELVPGTRTVGFECTVSVSDVDAVAKAAIAAGGGSSWHGPRSVASVT